MSHHEESPDIDFILKVQQSLVPGYSMMKKFGRNASVVHAAWSLISASNFS